jgi:ABC-type transport system involved in cytochrome bd biosynthesis fused ATPase/permease subunit
MSSREEQFLNLYQHARLRDQLKFYDSRRKEFQHARAQLLNIGTALAILAGIAGLLAAFDDRRRPVWATLAVIFPVLATAVTAYSNLYAFDQQARLYRDAASRVDEALATAPDPSDLASGETVIPTFVDTVESIFMAEQGQWKQLVSKLPGGKPDKAPNNRPGGTD